MCKNIVEVNVVPYGSTGNITKGISKIARKNDYNVYTYFAWSKKQKKEPDKYTWIGSFFGRAMHLFLSWSTDLNGCGSIIDTLRLINRIHKYKVDVVHLHVLHSGCINLFMLLYYLKRHNVKVIWTMHDCWAMTGHCTHFMKTGCILWQTGCNHCLQKKQDPNSLVDNSKLIWKLKRMVILGFSDMTIVTPSKWLASVMKLSYFACYPVKVINNGIDLSIFSPSKEDIHKRLGCESKHIVLGVALNWGENKGLDVFERLAGNLDERFKVVLVGVDLERKKKLRDNIICIAQTSNQNELAQIYSAADVFVNPTRADTFPTVNIEALACGTPVITFDTGGSPEIIDKTCGSVIPYNDYYTLEKEVIRICEKAPYPQESCVCRAQKFDRNDKFKEYI